MDKTCLEVVEEVLVQCNLIDNQYQQIYKLLYNVTSNKSYAYLLNVVLRKLMLLKIYNTEFDEYIEAFTD